MRVAALLWLLGTLACSSDEAVVEPVRDAPPSRDATFIRAHAATAVGLLDAPARVIGSNQSFAVLSAPLEVQVLEVRVAAGDSVVEGQPLVAVRMPEALRAAGELAAARLREAGYEKRRNALSELQGQGLARSSEVLEVEMNVTLARADLSRARATLRSAGISDEQAVELLAGRGTSLLRAPIAGVVTAVNVRKGEMRAPSSGPLLELSAEARTRIEARFASVPPDGAKLSWIGASTERALQLDAVAPTANPSDGTRLVWLRTLDGASLPAGTIGRVHITAADDWVAVPAQALSDGPEGARVRVRRDAVASWVQVEVVARGAHEAIVRGLRKDDLVAANHEGAP